jgi:transposase
MKITTTVCGIDVSKLTLEVCYNRESELIRFKTKNNSDGYKTLIEKIGNKCSCIMESTGSYTLNVAFALKKAGNSVRIENSLVIKRYIQMNMERQKSDKSDAKWLWRYGVEHEGREWNMPSKENISCTQLLSL